MAQIVEMPRLSDTMTEGTIATWKKQVGESVQAGEGFAEIETDKAVMVFESFDAGVVLALLLKPGDTVPLGTPMAVLGKAGEDVTALVAEASAKVQAALAGASGAAATTVAPRPALAPEAAVAVEGVPSPAPVVAPAAPAAPPPSPPTAAPVPVTHDADGQRIPASPLARRVAAQRGLDLAAVAGSGPRGRIVVADLEGLAPPRVLSGRLLARRSRPRATEDELVRVTQMRKTIAKRLVDAKNEAPHYYLTMTVDAGRLVALRTELNQLLASGAPPEVDPKGAKDALKLSFNDLVMRASVLALGAHPAVNAGWEGAVIRRFAGVHLGFAVALPEGLITPVIRNADALGLVELAERTRDLAERARAQSLESADYTGNSFCVSNLGMFGIDHFTAIINPPAACILAVGALVEAPVVRSGQLAIGHRMTVTLSCDHRVVDGATGAAFMKTLRGLLEAPTALVLD